MPESVQELTHDQPADDLTSQLLNEIESEATVRVCSVAGNDLGDIHYVLYLEDPLNLDKPIALSFTINPDDYEPVRADGTRVSGHIQFMRTEDALLLEEDYEKFKKWLEEEKQKEQA